MSRQEKELQSATPLTRRLNCQVRIEGAIFGWSARPSYRRNARAVMSANDVPGAFTALLCALAGHANTREEEEAQGALSPPEAIKQGR